MILSLTFWKVLKTSSGEEKKYIQSTLGRERIYKDLDFWITAILMSIIEEINHQKDLKLEESETIEDTIVRQGSIVFGHLVTFARNMSCFMIDKSECKKVVKQFC